MRPSLPASPVFLDTCALLFIAQGEPLRPAAAADLETLWREGISPQVSPISAWEVGLLAARGRIALAMSPERWWAAAVSALRLELAPMPPELLIASTALPGTPPNDPADRIVAATAREYGLRLMTRDERLLGYGEAGNLGVVAC